ncbi:hypothetical protein SMD44_p10017 (plasmid) [Streptomyces alboflavus]|uniref:N-acetyltransferase domain-containing protein n=1 Tax=Streptomyces alboflavus TaxID=67267 RepID=A0A291W4D5_9ACTN|nr:GNAT family N-acetyltransferase [Streptomyces alboflavus]ATM24516.1 hypothetical protein SMD44_p10017 [Streptomyces alboflavus]
MRHIDAVNRGSLPLIPIESASFRDLDAFCELVSLVDPGQPVPLSVPIALSLRPGRLTHGHCLCLVARVDGKVAGALIASPPRWADEHPLRASLGIGVLYIAAVSVFPKYRSQGIASRLLRAAERHSRMAGVRLLTLEHPPGLTGFYTRHGFTAGQERMLVVLPNGVQERKMPGHLSAVKPIAEGVRLAQVPGAPAPLVTGLLTRGCEIPPSAHYSENGLSAAP